MGAATAQEESRHMVMVNGRVSNSSPSVSTASMTCNCACSICLLGYCCMFPPTTPYEWWPPTLFWPYVTQPYTVTTGTTLTPGWACAKCGGDKIGTRYHTGTWPTGGGSDHSQKQAEGPTHEHLHRTCQTCGL